MMYNLSNYDLFAVNQALADQFRSISKWQSVSDGVLKEVLETTHECYFAGISHLVFW